MPPPTPAAPAPTPAGGLYSLAVDQLVTIGEYLPPGRRLTLLHLSKPLRAHLLGPLLDEITIPDWASRAGPADVVRLLRLLPPGRVRALRIGCVLRVSMMKFRAFYGHDIAADLIV